MHKTLFLSLCLFSLFSTEGYAQKIRMGFLAGPTLTFAGYDFPADRKISNPGPPGDYIKRWTSEPGPGFFAGFEIEYDFTDKLFVASGVTLNNNSFSASKKEAYITEKLTSENQYRFSIISTQLPVLLHYRIKKFSVGIGGYGGLAITGNGSYKQLDNQVVKNKYSQALVFNNKEMEYADFKRINAGLRAELGYGIKRWRVTGHFDLGLLNLSPKTPSSDEEIQRYALKRSSLGFSFLYQPWPR